MSPLPFHMREAPLQQPRKHEYQRTPALSVKGPYQEPSDRVLSMRSGTSLLAWLLRLWPWTALFLKQLFSSLRQVSCVSPAMASGSSLYPA